MILSVLCFYLLCCCLNSHSRAEDMLSLQERIPRILHYIWVGPNPKTELVHRNIASWRANCPDCLIVEWNDDTVMKINISYVQQAYAAKRYAFVADYIRLFVVNMFGGVYLDSDVELRQPIYQFLKHNFFMGHERCAKVNAGAHMFGGVKNNKILQELMSEFEREPFRRKNGAQNLYILPHRMNRYFLNKYNASIRDHPNEEIQLGNDSVLYPWWYFSRPSNGRPSYAKHYYSGTWWTKNMKQTEFLSECWQQCKAKNEKIQSQNLTAIVEREAVSNPPHDLDLTRKKQIIIVLAILISCILLAYLQRYFIRSRHYASSFIKNT